MSYRTALPRRRVSRATVPFVVATAALALGAQPYGTPSVAPGLLYTMEMTTQDVTGGKSREIAGMTARSQLAGGSMRMEFVEAKGAQAAGPMKKGGYILLLDEGSRMLIVDPKEKSYLEMQPDAIFGMFNAMTAASGGMMKFEITDVSSSVRKLGAGDMLLGHKTDRYELTQRYKTKMSIMGMRQESTEHSVTEYWIAPALTDWMNPFLQAGKSMATGMLQSAPEWAQQLAEIEKQIPTNGAVLKSVTRSTTTDGKGKEQQMLSTAVVTQLERGDVPASAFVVPAGYKRTEMPSLAGLSDSINAAKARGDLPADFNPALDAKEAAKDGVREGVKEETKAGAKDATKKAIGGLLRGKRPPL